MSNYSAFEPASSGMSILLSLTQQFSTNAGHCCRLQVSRTCVGRKAVSLQSTRGNFTKMQKDSLNHQQNGNQIKTFVVCGPSGSGKTTLLEMVTSFYKDCFKFCVSRKLVFRSPSYCLMIGPIWLIYCHFRHNPFTETK